MKTLLYVFKHLAALLIAAVVTVLVSRCTYQVASLIEPGMLFSSVPLLVLIVVLFCKTYQAMARKILK